MNIYDLITMFQAPVSGTFILDTVTALNGYSLRKLKSTATKSIRVRRSSDNTEQDIGFVGEDLDETSLLSFVGVSDAFVTTFYNQVNNGSSDNYIQLTQGNQPRIVSSGVIDKCNLKPTMEFLPDATQRSFNITKSLSQPHMYMYVLKSNSYTSDQFFIRDAGGFNWTGSYSIGFNRYRMASSSSLNSNLAPDQQLTSLSTFYNSSSSVIDDDGNAKTGDAGSFGATNPTLGFSWNGCISELIITSSEIDKSTIRNSQRTYYSI